MKKAYLEDIPREVTISSILLAVIGAVQFVPSQFIQGLPASSFLSGFFGNMVDFVLIYSAQLPFHSYTLGFTLLLAATAPFLYSQKAWVFSFLTQIILALYGFLGLIIVLEAPYLVSDTVILGLGLQVLVTGFMATQIFQKVLKSEALTYEVDKVVYAVSTWQYLTAVVVLTAFQYVYQFRAVPIYAVLFTVLGLYGVLLIYAAVEMAVNSSTGLMLTGSFLTLLFLSSLFTFSVSGIFAVFVIGGLLYWKREMFEMRHSLKKIREFEL